MDLRQFNMSLTTTVWGTKPDKTPNLTGDLPQKTIASGEKLAHSDNWSLSVAQKSPILANP
jgi:hypothetical protein